MTTSAMFETVRSSKQGVTGVIPPQSGEAVIREAWPALSGPLAILAHGLIRTIILAPIGWLLLAPLFVKKITPFLGKRYILTNRRLMIVRFGSKTPYREIKLEDIDKDGVLLPQGSYSEFYRTGTLEIISGGQVALRLRAVPEPDGFRVATLNACKAWAPKKHTAPPEQLITASK
jgi:hypothetical protein